MWLLSTSTEILLYVNSSINLFVYAARGTHFREEAGRLINVCRNKVELMGKQQSVCAGPTAQQRRRQSSFDNIEDLCQREKSTSEQPMSRF